MILRLISQNVKSISNLWKLKFLHLMHKLKLTTSEKYIILHVGQTVQKRF